MCTAQHPRTSERRPDVPLSDYRADAMRCTRCSYCKWIPFDLVKSHRFSKGCPSVEANHFHSYSAGGRLITALSLMDGRSEVSDKVVDIAFKCQLCGNCDVGLQDVPLRHGAARRAARVACRPRGPGPCARDLRSGDRARACGQPRGGEDGGRALGLGRGTRPQGPLAREGRGPLLCRLQVQSRGEPAAGSARRRAGAARRRRRSRPAARGRLLRRAGLPHGLPGRLRRRRRADARGVGRAPA